MLNAAREQEDKPSRFNEGMSEVTARAELKDSSQPTPTETDQPQLNQKPQNPLDMINDDELATYITNLLKNDISDKEQGEWAEKRAYDINVYEGKKKPTDDPWINCSNFPVPMTSTLVDTAHANIIGSIFSDPENTTDVQGVGVEDIRKAPILGQMLNWQVNTDTGAYEVWDTGVFRSLHVGTSFIKVTQNYFKDKIDLECIQGDNIYLPLDAKGLQIGDSDHVFEVIPLTYNDIIKRRLLKDKQGKPMYDGIEDIPPGLRLNYSTAYQSSMRNKDSASGTRLDQRSSRDLYYIMECYLTYYPGDGKGGFLEAIELIVWMAPSSNKILRKAINRLKVRPYVDLRPYPRDDRFWGMSLPEKIRYIQEELDYSHNQNINAADIAIRPPTYIPADSDWNADENQAVPGGVYKVSDPGKMYTPSISVNPIFERQEDRYWDMAERLTGLTELFQGRTPSKTKTLGEAKLRNNRSEIRFKVLYQRYEKAWSDMIKLIYLYDVNYMPRDKKINILGVADFKNLDELFPEGMEGIFNFTFRNAPITEIEMRQQKQIEMCEYLLTQPNVTSNVGDMWRIQQRLAENKGERNFEVLVKKPEAANILSAEEVIQRIMSGQYDIVPEPGIDAANYMLRFGLFMTSETFNNSKPPVKQAFANLIRRVMSIQKGQIRGMADSHIIQRGPQDMQAQPDQQPLQVVQ